MQGDREPYWLNPQPCFPKPFQLVWRESSEKKYRRLLKQFMVLIFRAYCLDPEVRHSLTGIRFKKRQMACIKRVWDHRVWDLGPAEEPLLERSEESLEETNSIDVSSEDEGIPR